MGQTHAGHCWAGRFFRAFAKFAIHPRFLFADQGEVANATAEVEALCAKAGVKPRNIKPDGFVTYANALAALYRRTSPPNGIVPSID